MFIHIERGLASRLPLFYSVHVNANNSEHQVDYAVNRLVREIEKQEQVRVGATLREFRKCRGIKLIDMARYLGISHSYLSNIENGRARLTSENLCKSADVLKIPQIALVNPTLYSK